MSFNHIFYIIVSLSARSIFHAYVAAILLFLLPRFIFKRLAITIPGWVLVIFAFVISICKEAIDYLLAQPEALGSVENMLKNLTVLGICLAGFILALAVSKKGIKGWPLIIVFVTLSLSVITSFLLTYSLPITDAAPLYKSLIDVISFSVGGYFFYSILKRSTILT